MHLPKIGGRISKNKRTAKVKRDVISHLHDALLLQILFLLPTIDAIWSSVLSKRWRSLWKHVKKLDYDHRTNRSDKRTCSEFINRFLILHKSRILDTMRLAVGSDCTTADFEVWIKYAVEHGVRELELDPYLDKEIITLPSNIYNCKTLEILVLKNCICVDVPASKVCFPSLKILNLHLVYFKNDDSVPRLFSSCPNLEELVVVRYVDNVINFRIDNVASLKRLSIHDRSDGDGRRGYVINAPSLDYLSIIGLRDFEFSLADTPVIREAKILDIFEIQAAKILLPIASSLKHLSLSLSPLETWYDESIVFHQLVYLKLSTSKTEWPKLLVILLMNSPKLQVLKLIDEDVNKEHASSPKFTEPVHTPFCLLFKLQRFQWERYNGQREEERRVAAYILSKAKHLKVANISTSDRMDDKHEMLKALASEPRASPSCRLFLK